MLNVNVGDIIRWTKYYKVRKRSFFGWKKKKIEINSYANQGIVYSKEDGYFIVLAFNRSYAFPYDADEINPEYFQVEITSRVNDVIKKNRKDIEKFGQEIIEEPGLFDNNLLLGKRKEK